MTYEKKGLPKKAKTFFTIMAGFCCIVGVAILVYAFTAKAYTGWSGYSMGNRAYMSHSGGITSERRTFFYIIGFALVLVGAICIDVLRAAKNNYIRICGNRIEGKGAFGFISKPFDINVAEVQEVIASPNGLFPTLLMKTTNAQNYFVFVDNPNEVKKIIQEINSVSRK